MNLCGRERREGRVRSFTSRLTHQGGAAWENESGGGGNVDESEEHRTDETDDNSRQQAMRHTATDELYVTLRSTSTWHVMFFLRHRVQVRVQTQLCSFLQFLSDSECNVSDEHDNIQQQQNNSEAEDVPCNTWMDG